MKGVVPVLGGAQSEWSDTSHAVSDLCLKICNKCGTDEAIAQFAGGGRIPPIAGWATLRTSTGSEDSQAALHRDASPVGRGSIPLVQRNHWTVY